MPIKSIADWFFLGLGMKVDSNSDLTQDTGLELLGNRLRSTNFSLAGPSIKLRNSNIPIDFLCDSLLYYKCWYGNQFKAFSHLAKSPITT